MHMFNGGAEGFHPGRFYCALQAFQALYPFLVMPPSIAFDFFTAFGAFMKHPLLYLTCLSAFSSAFATNAAAEIPADHTNTTHPNESRLEELIVSANLYATSVFDVMGTATVVTNADIERFQPANLGEIFEQQSGLDIVRNGGPASNTSLFTRGTNSSHTLILINGQRFSSASLGVTQFNFVDPEQIDRIEVVRGSRSALYGSDAIGGVLQIFTKRGSEAPEPFINLEAGSHATYRLAAGTSDTLGQFGYSGSLSYEQSDSIDSLVDDTGTNIDKDGYQNLNANLFGGYRFMDKHELSVFYWQSQSEVDFDSSFSTEVYPVSDNLQSAGNIQLDLQVSNTYQTKFSVGHSQDKAKIAVYSSEFNTYRNTLYWQNDIRLVETILVNAGLDYEATRMGGTTEYEEDSRDVLAGFVQLHYHNNKFDVQAGSRHDNNSAFDNISTQSFSSAFNFSDTQRTFISWNEGFRAPTFNDLYYANLGNPDYPNSGNPDLLPEQSETLEWGLKGKFDDIDLQFSLFKNTIENLIDWAPSEDEPFNWRPQNIAKANIKGAEFIASFLLNEWNMDTGFYYVDPKDHDTNRPLANRAKLKLTLDAHRAWQKFSLGFLLKAQSTRYSNYDPFAGTQKKLPGHATVGVYASLDVFRQLQLSIKLNNLFDKNYRLNELYNEDGFNGSIKLNYQFY